MEKKNKIDKIREQTIDLVATAIEDDEISAIKRADLALKLLSRPEMEQVTTEPAQNIEIVFRIVDVNGNEMPEPADGMNNKRRRRLTKSLSEQPRR